MTGTSRGVPVISFLLPFTTVSRMFGPTRSKHLN